MDVKEREKVSIIGQHLLFRGGGTIYQKHAYHHGANLSREGIGTVSLCYKIQMSSPSGADRMRKLTATFSGADSCFVQGEAKSKVKKCAGKTPGRTLPSIAKTSSNITSRGRSVLVAQLKMLRSSSVPAGAALMCTLGMFLLYLSADIHC